MAHYISWKIKTYESLPSTQNTLKEMIVKHGAEEGVLIHALKQTGGYGRHGRKWEGASGNLSFSFLLTPDSSPMESITLSLVTGIALTRVIQDILGLDSDSVILKWPNDIMIKGEKCAGILLENIDKSIGIGIGLNIKSAPIEEATCLAEHCGKEHSPDSLINLFLNEFDKLYEVWKEKGFGALQSEYMGLSYKKDTPVCVKLPKNRVEGLFQGVDEGGAALILCKDTQKLQKITAGDVFLV